MTNTITLEQVKTEAQRVIEQFGPDHFNPGVEYRNGCFYTDHAGRHCIAGQIIVNLGHSVPEYGHAENSKTVGAVSMFDGVVSRDALDYLSAVQCEADGGASWSLALAVVEED